MATVEVPLPLGGGAVVRGQDQVAVLAAFDVALLGQRAARRAFPDGRGPQGPGDVPGHRAPAGAGRVGDRTRGAGWAVHGRGAFAQFPFAAEAFGGPPGGLGGEAGHLGHLSRGEVAAEPRRPREHEQALARQGCAVDEHGGLGAAPDRPWRRWPRRG
ncbi:hypothetical protein [Streptomyces sp. NPDC086122]|uniref:hypothetical protein n=1 Tax=Streptomyces sp. NPDC086122 TaxID=3155294 RepID=UPI0034446B6A